MSHKAKIRIPKFPAYHLTQVSTDDDLKTIEKLAEIIWPEYYSSIISRGQIRYMLRKMYSLSVLQNEFRRGVMFFIVHHKNKPIGFISISKKSNHYYFLHKFYLLKSKRGKGLGYSVFNTLIQNLKAERIRLTVNRQNYKSINFYFKCGFCIEKVADFDIGKGYFMNDFVMLWKKKKALMNIRAFIEALGNPTG
ncbi:MAG: GNAT family N-acetyltransferase [Bacteroidia bacterium]|nr:GNAT family N-acetyltransferase [Bacteroidia bacterium]